MSNVCRQNPCSVSVFHLEVYRRSRSIRQRHLERRCISNVRQVCRMDQYYISVDGDEAVKYRCYNNRRNRLCDARRVLSELYSSLSNAEIGHHVTVLLNLQQIVELGITYNRHSCRQCSREFQSQTHATGFDQVKVRIVGQIGS